MINKYSFATDYNKSEHLENGDYVVNIEEEIKHWIIMKFQPVSLWLAREAGKISGIAFSVINTSLL